MRDSNSKKNDILNDKELLDELDAMSEDSEPFVATIASSSDSDYAPICKRRKKKGIPDYFDVRTMSKSQSVEKPNSGKTKFKIYDNITIRIPIRKTMRIISTVCLLLVLKLVRPCMPAEEHHSRQKRILWVTSDGRLALPPGTTLVIAPSLSLPFVRYPPDGFFSNMTISLPFTIDFSKLGLTDNENPYGIIPPLLDRSIGRAAGNLLANYIGTLIAHRRNKRAAGEKPPEPPPEHKYAFHGGERALLYTVVEDFLENFGLDGKACLLRAICEVHAHPLRNFGLLGEVIKLFFSASKSPFSDLLLEYVEAENAGKGKSGASECWPYMKDCPKSLFENRHNPYSKVETNHEDEQRLDNEKFEREVVYNPSLKNM
ncbi:hypothetical protein RN001_000069 [Aquatica leii]|uniref:Uncharacterized protein n=1 Tax=Aquatica leii TaxID=1421715 RepID=A0AAN7SQF7_9COLE|nr:hypothetical protein RN001_000069 [Aquatica leii]